MINVQISALQAVLAAAKAALIKANCDTPNARRLAANNVSMPQTVSTTPQTPAVMTKKACVPPKMFIY